MEYTCLNCYKKKDIEKMRNKTVCNRCFKREIKKNKKLAKKEKSMLLLSDLDGCKNCGAYSLECDYCKNFEFYRHIDDKKAMKINLLHIRLMRASEFKFEKAKMEALCPSLEYNNFNYSSSEALKVSVVLKCDNCKEEFLIYNLFSNMFCWGSKNWDIDEYREKDYIFCPLCFHNPNNGEKERLIEVVRYRISPRLRI